MKHSNERVKLAIIGSGAIAEEGYLPAADIVSNITITHVVDLDTNRARDVANRFGIPHYASDYRDVLETVDAVVVATPPSSHAHISIDCLNHGLHVLCEKPLAPSVEEATQMIAARDRTGARLGAAMVRRLSWSAQLLKKLVETGVLGDIHRFDVEEGWEFNWPLRTGHVFQDKNVGGVLADTGPHVFDLLLWILGGHRAQVIDCCDDNWGGVEVNACVELTVQRASQTVTGNIELSFTRRLRNTLKIYGVRGCLEAATVGAHEVYFYPINENKEPIILRPQNDTPRKKNEEFSAQLANFADSIINNSKKYVPAEDAVVTMALVEACYRQRKLMAQPWEIRYLESFFEDNKND
jgi:predicted dehydrogenase